LLNDNGTYERVKFYTMPYITMKLKCELNKIYALAYQMEYAKQLAKTAAGQRALNEAQQDLLKAFEQDAEVEESLMYKQPLTDLLNDFERAAEFCIICIDKGRTLQQENGEKILQAVGRISNWESQPYELVEAIVNMYCFRPLQSEVVS